MNRFLDAVLVKALRGYQLLVSPWFAPTCRYYPSCSQYAIEAIREHGAIKGSGAAAWRVLRCNPWSKGGVDHVPPKLTAPGSSQDAAVVDADRARSAGVRDHATDPQATDPQARRRLHGIL